MEFSAQQIAEFLTGTVEGDSSVKVSEFSKIEEGRPGTLSFLSNPKYEHYIYDSDASIVLVNKGFVPERAVKATLIRVDDAYESLARLLNLVETNKQKKRSISPLAYIDPTAEIGEDASIAPFVYVGENVKIGNHATLYAGVSIYTGTVIGNNCIIHSNAVVGSDGFGFAPTKDGSYEKIPQTGNVVIEDDVEIGANSTIDRATFGSTRIAKGVKIDNLVQVAHNVEIGENCVLAAQTGIAGSSKIGKHVMFGGQSGVVGHIQVADGTMLGAKAGVTGTIKVPGQIYSGFPAVPINTFRRSYVVNKNLPELQKTVNQLTKKIEELEKRLQSGSDNS